MNPGRGWNADLEESYLLECNEFEAETFTQSTSGIFLWHVKFSALEPSPISRYRECTKTTSLSILGFFRLRVKLGFDFPEISLNQKIRTWTLKFDFDEERNYMLGSITIPLL